MSAYTSGSVNVRVGSASVKGNSTSFTTFVTAGDLFALDDTKVFYDIAAVVSATRLTLSSRYADTDHETTRADEHIATTNTGSLAYSHTLANTPVILNSVSVDASEVTWSDDGAGVLATTSGGSLGAAGTISYDDGSITVNYNASPTVDLAITASYNSGDTLNVMSYRVVTDFTSNYEFPEMGDNDADMPRIFTRAMREIDSNLYDLTLNSLNISATDPPVNATSPGTLGDIRHDASYLYLCVDSDTWKRTLMETW
jgi:hypothetical protein